MQQSLYQAFLKIVTGPLLLLGILHLLALPAAANQLTLEQCQTLARQNNPALQAARQAVESAGHDRRAVRADFLPSLSTSWSLNYIDSDKAVGPADADYLDQHIQAYNIRLTQILFAGFRLRNTYHRAGIAEELAQAQVDLEQLELAYRVEVTFYRLLKAKQDVIMVSEAVSRLTESVRAAEAFFAKELVPYMDVLQARVDLSDAREQLGMAQNNVNRERVALFALMNLPPEPALTFAGDLDIRPAAIPSLESSLQHALQHRPDILALHHQLEMVRKDVDINLGRYQPRVQVEAGYFNRDRKYDKFERMDQRNQYWSAGVTVSWDLFDGGRGWYTAEKFNTQSQRIESLMEEARNTISTGIQRALFSMAEAQTRIQSTAEALIAAREYYTMQERSLLAGLSTIPALLEAQYRLVRAQGNQTRAGLDYQLARAELRLMEGGGREW